MKTMALQVDPLTGESYAEVYLRGSQLLADPLLNKGSCFTREERASLGLRGLLPYGVSTIEEQLRRTRENFDRKSEPLEKYIYLLSLLNRSEVLFYRFLLDNLEELVPIVYTPTVGQACQMMSRIWRNRRGLYIHPANISAIDEVFANVPNPEVRLIVVTDGERILGLGDLGADGMGIPVGKVSLYVAAGGVHPALCLPVQLDVGTNNERLLNDPLYMGTRQPRLEGQAYWDFIERFALGVKRSFPGALVQWEDFAKEKAFTLLRRYRERLLSFDDDIQGTGAITAAAVLTALRIRKIRGRDEKYVLVGAGQAGTGIAWAIRALLEDEGLSREEARRRIFMLDRPGLLLEDTPGLEEWQREFAQPREAVSGWRLESPGRIGILDVLVNTNAGILVGVTAIAGLFDERILAQLARNADRPAVFALSNPTSRSECTAEDAIRHTEGRALVATGSPFPPVRWQGREIAVSQCNNVYMFPGVGLGALVIGASRVTERMFVAASRALSALVTEKEREQGLLLPVMGDIRKASHAVALAAAREARDSGIGRLLGDEELVQTVARSQWEPRFYPYRPGTLRREP